MCGIAGFWQISNLQKRDLPTLIKPMLERIEHRGPDDHGIWCLENEGLVLGHRRLSIVDLSAFGHQPMHSHDKRYTISYNGEIYNFKQLKEQLVKEGITFKSDCDTEVLVELVAQEGLENALEKINGMFAFSLWDNKKKCLHLVRDRLGEKSLYWGVFNNVLLFGSELKALIAYPEFRQNIDKKSLHHYFHYGYTPEGKTILKDMNKLLAGHITTVRKQGDEFSIVTKAYWKAEDSIKERNTRKFSCFKEAQTEFENLFTTSINNRSICDVPLGCFLSGGIDSTLVAAFMQKERKLPLKTFSVGFDEHGYDESSFATGVAKHLKTDHHTIQLKESDVPQLFHKLIEVYDEPFGDASQLPTLKVSELAAKQVKVVLTGDGADEVFAGYNRHVFMDNYFQKWIRFPSVAKKSLQTMVKLCEISLANKQIIELLPPKYKTKFRQERFKKLSRILEAKNPSEFYEKCVKIDIPFSLLKDMENTLDSTEKEAINNSVMALQLQDLATYLPGDILTKLDRATMSCSLEGRAPFLDHKIVEFGLQLPTRYKIKNGKGKYILRKTLEKYVPVEYFERPKTGFGLPLEIWLKQGLKSWCEDIIFKGRKTPFINYKAMNDAWKDMPRQISSGQAAFIWRCLVWISWWEKYKKFLKV